MNTLLSEMIRSLHELELGYRGELTMSDSMEELATSLFLDKVLISFIYLTKIHVERFKLKLKHFSTGSKTVGIAGLSISPLTCILVS